MADLSLSFSDIYQKVAENWGIVDIGTAPTGINLTTVKNMVYRGYRNFLFPVDARTGKRHIWSFLKQYATITTSGNQYKYSLPEDFGRIHVDFRYGKSDGYSPLNKRDAGYILQERNWTDMTTNPEIYAIVPAQYDPTIGTTWDVWFYPTPDGAYTLHYFYLINPKKPENDTDKLIGGIEASEAILESCLAIVESQEDDMATSHHSQLATKLIQELITGDTVDLGDGIGKMTDPSIVEKWPMDRPLLTEIQDDNIYS
jgi:hypothetical protein